jgi:signal peptidase II
MTGIGKRVAVVILVVATVGCDRVTKHFAASTLTQMPRQSFLADTVRLEYVENPGAFLGLGAEWPPKVRIALFTVGNALLLLAMAVAARRLPWSGPALAGLCLLMAGGGSNLADRVAHGSVIDFLNVGLGPLRTGIFNVADMAVMLGVVLIVYGSYHSGEEPNDANITSITTDHDDAPKCKDA